ncbi:hypothetical protein ACIBUY_37280 [Streptomyces sp. NPDC050085]|uniref:hypothetical protein n=1 Tax=Streptomyces sp. NPDC050085 TaxID=3365600 RepID=UPI0037A44AC4
MRVRTRVLQAALSCGLLAAGLAASGSAGAQGRDISRDALAADDSRAAAGGIR